MASALHLRAGREKSLLRHHPWVFSGAVDRIQGPVNDGDTIQIVDARGAFLAWGSYSAASRIQARVLSWNPDERIDAAFFHQRLESALAVRQGWMDAQQTDAYRLVHAESDGLPGLVVDRYADTLVVQFLSSGAERWRADLTHSLMDLSGAARAYERSDVDVRKLEGLPLRAGPLHGDEPDGPILIRENGLQIAVDVRQGHKTGYYLDQRRNRRLARGLACGKESLDCFSYTGGFMLNLLAGGATSVLAVDSSKEALAAGRNNLRLNNLPEERMESLEADVFQALRLFRDQGRAFDLIVLDPPKFAPTAAQAERAARGYKDINLLAFKLLRAGGTLITFSCSGGVSEDLFQKIVAGAALDAGAEAQILERLYQGPDHPVALNFPEGLYLKGLVVRKNS